MRFFIFSEENAGCVDLGLAVEVGAHFIDKYSPVVGGYYVWQNDAPLCGRYISAAKFEIDYALAKGADSDAD